MSSNLFSGDGLPKIKMNMPRINKSLPNIKLTEDSDLLFDIDGQNVTMSEVADKFSTWFMNM